MKRNQSDFRAIPYGITDYIRIREEKYLYVDKTSYIPSLEKAGSFLFLIRPRRFGKSLHMIMLETYYDLYWKDKFDNFFTGTWIHQHPTKEQGKYLIIKFNFSGIDPHPGKLEHSFEEYISRTVKMFVKKYAVYLRDQISAEMETISNAFDKLSFLLDILTRQKNKLYVMIDEYDNFANTILSTHGEKQYQAITHGKGFLHLFFNILKQGTTSAGAGIAHLFITGVSPIVMDNVTSGFNIGKNISLDPWFNSMLGLTTEDVENILEEYQHTGALQQKKEVLLEIMSQWYNSYKFSIKAEESVFNTDMVLYFLDQCLAHGEIPQRLIDHNVRIDYGKLRHLMVLDRTLNGNFSCLKAIIETGKISAELTGSFPLEELMNPDNFISLLYYFGLLTPHSSSKGKTILTIPNQSIREFFYRYFSESYKEVDIFRVEMQHFFNLMAEMAYDGKWEALFGYLAGELKKQTRIRDYLTGEKMIQGFFLAYLNLPGHYTVHSEYELNKGYADLYFEPFFIRFPDMPYSWLLELKYFSRTEYDPNKIPDTVEQAKKQLLRYKGDDYLKQRMGSTDVRCLVIIFSGWEMVHAEEISIKIAK